MSVVLSGARAPEASAVPEIEQRVVLGGDVGRGLQDGATLTQDAVEAPVLGPRRERGRERSRAHPVAADLVPRVGHAREPQEAPVDGVVERGLHARLLVLGGLALAVRGGLEPHHGHAQVRVSDERHDVGTERQRVHMLLVALRVAPGLVRLECIQHVLAWQRLHAREDVRAVFGGGVDGAQRARADAHRGHAVAHRLGQARRQQQLGVVVRVRVQESGHHPLACGVHDVVGERRVDGGLDGGDLAVDDAHVGDLPGGARAVEDRAGLDEDVVAHGR